jgi:hypothetical protein
MHLPHKLIIKKETLGKVKGITKSTFKVVCNNVSCSFWWSRGGYNDSELSRDTNMTSYTVMVKDDIDILDWYIVELLVNWCTSIGDYVVRNPTLHVSKFGTAKNNIEFTAVKR